jgi:hypothetical protein
MSQREPTRIDVSKAIETAYWFGMVDGIRDTYRMVFKDPNGSNRLNTALSETLDRVMELANLEQKNMAFILQELYHHNDLASMKQTLWSTVLLGLPEFRNEIVFNKHMTKLEGNLKEQLLELDKRRKEKQ